jgi:hypothetical protein
VAENAPESRLHAAQHIRGLIVEPDGPGAPQIITGLLNLNMMVLMELMEARNITPEDMLKEADNYLREYSRRPPEWQHHAPTRLGFLGCREAGSVPVC